MMCVVDLSDEGLQRKLLSLAKDYGMQDLLLNLSKVMAGPVWNTEVHSAGKVIEALTEFL
jgi:hypothetical protein